MNLVVFDLDGTLTQSRSIISENMRAALEFLPVPFVVISGATEKQIREQVPIPDLVALGQSGNEYFGRQLAQEDKDKINAHIQEILDTDYIKAPDPEDLVEDRGSQISLSLMGHHADKQKKLEFDPDGSQRKKLLELHPFKEEDLQVFVAGTTCLDYVRKGWDKGSNIAAHAKKIGVDLDDVIYFGDQLYPGGNDESVKSICRCIEVSSPDDTLTKLQQL